MNRIVARRMAIAACCLGAVVTVGGCGGVGDAISEVADEIDDESAGSLESGDCFNWDELGYVVEEVDTNSCDDPHDAEVYTVIDLDGGDWPGEDAVAEQADQGCYNLFEAAVGLSYEESIYDYGTLTPTQDGWEDGDHEVVCILLSQEPVTGSLLGSAE